MAERLGEASDTSGCVGFNCSTAIFLKICFQCSRAEIPIAYAGRWVAWCYLPRIGDSVVWSKEEDDFASVEEIYWHVRQNAVEIIATRDCDSTVDALLQDNEEVSFDSVYGYWLETAYKEGFNYKHASEDAMAGHGGVPSRK